MKRFTLFTLGLLIAASLCAQVPVPTESMGSYIKSPEQKALECYARGMKAKRKAESEKDPQKQAKLYLKAKEELSKSIGYQGHYDGYLALGRVYLALGMNESGFDACSHAQSAKPNSEEAKSCVQEAREKLKMAANPEPDGGGGN
jgi:cytochrome c-type biogenesis protein CcmH/NrfG